MRAIEIPPILSKHFKRVPNCMTRSIGNVTFIFPRHSGAQNNFPIFETFPCHQRGFLFLLFLSSFFPLPNGICLIDPLCVLENFFAFFSAPILQIQIRSEPASILRLYTAHNKKVQNASFNQAFRYKQRIWKESVL